MIERENLIGFVQFADRSNSLTQCQFFMSLSQEDTMGTPTRPTITLTLHRETFESLERIAEQVGLSRNIWARAVVIQAVRSAEMGDKRR